MTAGQRLRLGLPRVCLALGLLFAWAAQSNVLYVDGIPYASGLTALLPMEMLVTPVGFGVATLIYVVCALRWAGWRDTRAGWVAVVLMWVMVDIDLHQWPDDVGGNKAVVLPGAAVMAWNIADAVAARRGASAAQRERWGLEAACGVAAMGYFIAGVSKLHYSGLAWLTGGAMSIQIMSYATQGAAALIPFRLAVADQLWLCALFAWATIFIECGFLLFVLGWMRKPLSTLATLMHLGIALVMGLHHHDWMFMELGLAWYAVAPDGVAPRVDP